MPVVFESGIQDWLYCSGLGDSLLLGMEYPVCCFTKLAVWKVLNFRSHEMTSHFLNQITKFRVGDQCNMRQLLVVAFHKFLECGVNWKVSPLSHRKSPNDTKRYRPFLSTFALPCSILRRFLGNHHFDRAGTTHQNLSLPAGFLVQTTAKRFHVPPRFLTQTVFDSP